MAKENPESGETWNVLVVEDDRDVRRQVIDYLTDEVFASRKLSMSEVDLPKALNIIKEQKADLLILDIYCGDAKPGGEQTGIQILENIKKSGFVPVIIYTALPEGLEAYKSNFVRLVGKEARGLEKLKEEIGDYFRMYIPQLHRAVVDHLDQVLCSYMWGFVQEYWDEFQPIIEKPEFLRLVVQRLAMTFTRHEIEAMTARVYGTPAQGETVEPEKVHPAEYYIKPPIGSDPLLGDIRVREADGKKTIFVVLWPSCDMVSTGGRSPKTDHVLCAIASQADEMPEVKEWLESSPSKHKKEKVEDLFKNNRNKSPDRFHFLPGAWDIPDLVVDFQALAHLGLADIRALRCLATLASPYAEALAARFRKYVGRVGTPDLDVNVVVRRMRPTDGEDVTGEGDNSGS